jgi:hypothetical protein
VRFTVHVRSSRGMHARHSAWSAASRSQRVARGLVAEVRRLASNRGSRLISQGKGLDL